MAAVWQHLTAIVAGGFKERVESGTMSSESQGLATQQRNRIIKYNVAGSRNITNNNGEQ